MLALLTELAALRLAPVSPDTDRCAELLCDALPFVVHEYESGSEHNGWVVPQSWSVQRAEIRKNGHLVFDAMAGPLGVIGYSQPFAGSVRLEDLADHLFVHRDRPDAIPYHCELYYKQGVTNWGFAVPKVLRDQLSPGLYDVALETRHERGTMKVLEYTLPGDTDTTLVINAHNCHAGQANDDLSGVVAGVELMRRLAKVKSRRFTYRLIVAPEHFGTVFYLADRAAEELARFRFCIFLEAVGNDNRLAFQESFTGASPLDLAADLFLRIDEPNYGRFEFRDLVGNDETVWEAPGYQVPTVTLTRFPYPEYHTDQDTVGIISERQLERAVQAALSIALCLDENVTLEARFVGLVALSNPLYDLYLPPGTDPSLPSAASSVSAARWNRLMDRLPRYCDGVTTALDIAAMHALPFQEVLDYVRRWEATGLVALKGARYGCPLTE